MFRMILVISHCCDHYNSNRHSCLRYTNYTELGCREEIGPDATEADGRFGVVDGGDAPLILLWNGIKSLSLNRVHGRTTAKLI